MMVCASLFTLAVFCQTRKQSHQTSFNPGTPHLHVLPSFTPPTRKNQRWVHSSDKESPAVQTVGRNTVGVDGGIHQHIQFIKISTLCTSTDHQITRAKTKCQSYDILILISTDICLLTLKLGCLNSAVIGLCQGILMQQLFSLYVVSKTLFRQRDLPDAINIF